MNEILNFRLEFERVYEEQKTSYEAKGIVTANRKVYPLGTDTKVLSSIFELIIRPTVYEVAKQNDLIVKEARAQNYYPDFTLMRDETDPLKIAVDVKTTYRKRKNQKFKFTLGSYTSFIREGNETKNIEFPYSQYAEHWIVGFIYRRKQSADTPAHVYDLADLNKIPTPFEDVSLFVSRKWKIAGDKAGSGNTTNIGSIVGTLEDFKNESGPFESKEEFLEYWRNYRRTASERAGRYKNLKEFREWKQQVKKEE